MKLPCIAIDVSKGYSHARSFIKLDDEYGKLFSFNHDKEGLEILMTHYHELKNESGKEVVFIFESTGVYHKALEHFLTNNGMKFYIISPLQSAKVRKLEIRATKTDKLDQLNIARTYYYHNLDPHQSSREIYDELRQLDRYYETQMALLVKAKVHYRESLELVFPRIDEFFDVYDSCIIMIISKYHHPENIMNRQVKTIVDYLSKKNRHSKSYLTSLAITLIKYCSECVAGCSKNDVAVDILLGQLDNVRYYREKVDIIILRMKELAVTFDHYKLLISIPGIGDILATRLIAEIGDMSRFNSHKQLIAYAGIEPIVYQSGKKDGKHYRMSKKGNKILRKILYQAVVCSLRTKTQENVIKEYYKKKRQQDNPMYYRAAQFACANKLLRIIYGMYKSKTTYQ